MKLSESLRKRILEDLAAGRFRVVSPKAPRKNARPAQAK